MVKRQRMYTVIAEELWPDILKRLPVKSICRLPCVCKSWNSLLSSSFFTTHHLTFTTAACSTTSRTTTLFHIRYGREPTFAIRDQQDNTFTPLAFPFPPPQPFLLCLGVVHVYCNAPSKSIIVLWNPAIRKYVATPWPVAEHPSNPPFRGFGYDSRTDDFKIVITRTDYYEVFSARDGLWRRKPLPDRLKSVLKWHNTVANCFVDGCIYWLTTPKDNERLKRCDLLVFDCGNEELRAMDIPDQLQGQEFAFNPRLFVWGGLLRFLKPVSPCYENFELWTMMHKDGDKSTWSKLSEIDDEDIIIEGLRLTPLLNEQALFKRIDSDNRDADHVDVYAFQESMLLMDIGKACDEDQLKNALMQGKLNSTKSTQEVSKTSLFLPFVLRRLLNHV